MGGEGGAGPGATEAALDALMTGDGFGAVRLDGAVVVLVVGREPRRLSPVTALGLARRAAQAGDILRRPALRLTARRLRRAADLASGALPR